MPAKTRKRENRASLSPLKNAFMYPFNRDIS
jgi:hypothetical protein